MIRILQMIGSLNIGGAQCLMMELYRKIDKTQMQFDFILDHRDGTYFVEEVKKMGGIIFFMPAFNGKNIIQVRRSWESFFTKHPEYKILHSHVRSYASIFLPIAKRYGLKTIMHSHSTSNGRGIKDVLKKMLQYPIRYQADYFLSCSDMAGKWLFGKKVVKSNKYYVFHNAIDIERYKFDKNVREEYRRKLELGDCITYINVGRLHPAKNQLFLLDVFSEVCKKQSNSKLLLVGEGELRDRIEEKIKLLSIGKKVIMLGNRKDVAQLLQAADCFLFPSLWEGLGIAAIEAQAAGMECICSDKIPEDVKVTELCKFLPLNNKNEWVMEMLVMKMKRKDKSKQINMAGYDINNATKWINNFYYAISNMKA